MKNAPVTREHRELTAAMLTSEYSSCARAFVEQKPELCSCNGNSHPARRFVQAAQILANAQPTSALEELRKHEGFAVLVVLLKSEADKKYWRDELRDALAKLLATLEVTDGES